MVVASPSSPSRPAAWTRASCARPRATQRVRALIEGRGADVRVRGAHDDPALRPRRPPRAGSRRPRPSPRSSRAIRDRVLRPEYTRTVAGWLGPRGGAGGGEVSRPAVSPSTPPTTTAGAPSSRRRRPSRARREPRRLMQMPDLATPSCPPSASCSRCSSSSRRCSTPRPSTRSLPEAFSSPAHRAVLRRHPHRRAPRPAAAHAPHGSPPSPRHAPLAVRGLVSELAVAPLPTRLRQLHRPADASLRRLALHRVRDAPPRRIADAMTAVRRVQNDPEADPADLRERTHGPAPPRDRAGAPREGTLREAPVDRPAPSRRAVATWPLPLAPGRGNGCSRGRSRTAAASPWSRATSAVIP